MRGETRRHDSWCGLRWTCICRKACGTSAYGQAAWSCPPDAGVKFIEMINERRRLTSPVLRGDRGAAVQPLRRECRMFRPYLTTCGHFPFSPQGLRVRLSTRHSLRPQSRGSERNARPGRESAARECGSVCLACSVASSRSRGRRLSRKGHLS